MTWAMKVTASGRQSTIDVASFAQVARQRGIGARQLEPRAASGRSKVAVPKVSATPTTTSHPHVPARGDAAKAIATLIRRTLTRIRTL
jgi:hypothetical protein